MELELPQRAACAGVPRDRSEVVTTPPLPAVDTQTTPLGDGGPAANGAISATTAVASAPQPKLTRRGSIRMAEESWHEARLIPTSGINGADEQERRATSALLAVVSAVREFGRALVSRSVHQPARSRPTSRSRSSWARRSCTPMGSFVSAGEAAPGPRWSRSRPALTHCRGSSSRTTSTSRRSRATTRS
jgi:hypothetical protein